MSLFPFLVQVGPSFHFLVFFVRGFEKDIATREHQVARSAVIKRWRTDLQLYYPAIRQSLLEQNKCLSHTQSWSL